MRTSPDPAVKRWPGIVLEGITIIGNGVVIKGKTAGVLAVLEAQ